MTHLESGGRRAIRRPNRRFLWLVACTLICSARPPGSAAADGRTETDRRSARRDPVGAANHPNALQNREASVGGRRASPTTASRRFRFAQTYFGADGRLLDGSFIPSLTIGGLHFWRYADFYVRFPMWVVRKRRDDVSGSVTEITYPGIETGMSLYPLALTPYSLRPYAGLSWKAGRYQQRRGAVRRSPLDLHRVALRGGFSWHALSAASVDLGVAYDLFSERDYPVLANGVVATTRITAPRLSVSLGLRYIYDTTALIDEEASRARARERRRQHGLDAFFAGVGPSAGFQILRSDFYPQRRPHLSEKSSSRIFPDISVGYYSSTVDAVVQASYRPILTTQKAYGARPENNAGLLKTMRHVLALEAFKFVWDYYGFVPFVGLSIGVERLSFHDSTGPSVVNAQRWQPGVGSVFGWDIRPTDIDWFYLRTNLRYIWNPGLVVEGARVRTDPLEFNFIRFVVYIDRLFHPSPGPVRRTTE